MADSTISGLPLATTAAAAQEFIINDGGVNKKVRLDTLAPFIKAVTIAPHNAGGTVGNTEFTVTCDATAGSFPLTLPSASAVAGCEFTFIKTDNTLNTINVTAAGSDTIFQVGSAYLLEYAGEFVKLLSTGAAWLVTGE